MAELVFTGSTDHICPFTSTPNPTYLDIGNNFPDVSEIHESNFNTDENEKEVVDQDEKVILISITRSERGHPQYHFRYKGQNFLMKKNYSGKNHIVLICLDVTCIAKAKLVPDEEICLPPTDSKRPKVHLNEKIKESFNPVLVLLCRSK